MGAIGFGFVVSAVAIAVTGYRAEFSRRLELDKVKPGMVTALGRFGFVARAVVYATIGCFLVFAALHSHSSEAKGLVERCGSFSSNPMARPCWGSRPWVF